MTPPGPSSIRVALGRPGRALAAAGFCWLALDRVGAALPPRTEERRGRVFGLVRFSADSGARTPAPRRDLADVVVYLAPESPEAPPRGPAPPAAAAPAAPEEPRRHFLSQRGARFRPAALVVAAGDAVDFTNDDDIDHNVYSFSSAKRFDLGLYPRGRSKSVTFDRTGPVLLFCSVHEYMNALVYVAPSRLHALTDLAGRFAIDDVPVGRYRLRAWHAELPEGSEYVEVQPVDVRAGRGVRVEVDLLPRRREP